MTIEQIKILAHVCKSENATKTAHDLFLTQPAVARTIHDFERGHNIKLFERQNNKLHLTQTGQVFYQHALEILEAYNLMEHDIGNTDITQSIHLGAGISLGNIIMPHLCAYLKHTFPNLQVHVTVAKGSIIMDMLQSNELDMAFLIEGMFDMSRMHVQPFAQDKLQLILPNNHPLNRLDHIFLNDIIKYPLLMRDKGSVARYLIDHYFIEKGYPLSPLWESSSSHALISAVHSGIGLAILPESIILEAVQNNIVSTRSIEDFDLSISNIIVWRKDKYVTTYMRAISNYLICEYWK